MSITVVISTQFCENYGAHDWAGRGVCPQHWKPKGGDTYFVNATADDIADAQWWDAVATCINHSSEYSREYIISEKVVDQIDFKEADYVEFWESPTYASFDGAVLHCEKKVFDMDNSIVGIRRYIQDADGGREMTLTTLEEPVIEEWRTEAEMALFAPDEELKELRTWIRS